MPDNELSTLGKIAPFLVPDRTNVLVDYEWGGIDFNDVAQGLNYQIWTSSYVGSDVIISAGATSHTILTLANITALSFAFDFNMQPILTYVLNDKDVFLRWYDALNSVWVTDQIAGASTPQLSLDDFRESQRNNADVIFAYIKAGLLCIRLQRDRFAIEYPLGASTELYQIGMMQNYRFGFTSKAINSFAIEEDILLVNERNKVGRFDYFDLISLQSQYSVSFGNSVREAEGLASSRYAKGYERPQNAVQIGLILNSEDYDYFMAFYRVWQYKRKPFLVDLVVDGRALQEYKANFVLGSVSMSMDGSYHNVGLSLTILNNKLNKSEIKQIAESRNV